MSKKIAIPVDYSGILDSHFGHCKFFFISTEENGKIIAEEKIMPPPHEPGLLPKWLAEKGVTDIIAGGMGQMAIRLFNERGVNGFVGAPQLTSKELVEGYLSGTLSLTANYCNHEHHDGCGGH